jgi:hypothetical protein
LGELFNYGRFLFQKIISPNDDLIILEIANLNRFIYAQDEYGFSSILEELKLGREVGY